MNNVSEKHSMGVQRFFQRVKGLKSAISNVVYPPLQPAGIVIGTQKGGTTAIYNYLSYHPGVVCPRNKEIEFFGCDRRYKKGIEFYLSHFPRSSPGNKGKITLDFTPHYLGSSAKSAPRIHQYNPHIKLIALLRNPIDRAYSAWQMYRKYRQQNQDWFFKWVGRCEGKDHCAEYVPRPAHFGQNFDQDVRDEMAAIASGHAIEMPMLPQGCYAERLQPYFELFSRENLFIAASEEFRAETRSMLQRVEAFLSLAPYDWSDKEVRPRFQGQYLETPSARERALLNDFYLPHNQRLYVMLDVDFGWQ